MMEQKQFVVCHMVLQRFNCPHRLPGTQRKLNKGREAAAFEEGHGWTKALAKDSWYLTASEHSRELERSCLLDHTPI